MFGKKRIAHFEKVSIFQFIDDLKVVDKKYQNVLDENSKNTFEDMYGSIELPKRSTAQSAGYDFMMPLYGQYEIKPGESITFPTGIRVKIENNWFLSIVPRSGLGFKFKTRLANTIGIIDADYYNADNEGHIMIKLCNEGDKPLVIKHGDKIAQGIFLPYGITIDDDATGKRTGGFGSTDKTKGRYLS